MQLWGVKGTWQKREAHVIADKESQKRNYEKWILYLHVLLLHDFSSLFITILTDVRD